MFSTFSKLEEIKKNKIIRSLEYKMKKMYSADLDYLSLVLLYAYKRRNLLVYNFFRYNLS